MADLQKLIAESKENFRNPLGEFIYFRTYSRWKDEEHRRETWVETVDRYINFMKENLGSKLTKEEYDEVRGAILRQEVMPSMRLMWSAGDAARKTNVTGYNCSFVSVGKLRDFGEIMYLSMCGTGVGFSVESQTSQSLPQIKRQVRGKKIKYVVEDSKEGWADAFIFALKTWFDGHDVEMDYSKLRPAGTRLKTMGGKSSGPEPFISLINFTRNKVLKRQGRHLSNLDVHDIICKIGEIVVSGGVRRSALISLSDLDDYDMRHAKDGQFYLAEPQRMLSNNSAVYDEKPTESEFLEEWISLMKSGSGERGIFNRGGVLKQSPKRRAATWGKDIITCGTNPCGEIYLKSKEFCNLSEIVARAEDTEKTLLEKTRIATIIGTYQSTLTNFGYLSKKWVDNCEQERLLGVSITGQWDCPVVRNAEVMQKMKELAIKVNLEYSKRFKVNQSAAITCVKPSGTVSQLVDAASGTHPRHAEFYIRRVRISATDSLFKMLKDQGMKYYPEVGQEIGSATTYVLEFPVHAPKSDHYKDSLSAIEQLEYWKLVKTNYTEHNPSVTISIGEEEWIGVAHWLYQNWDIIGGLSFLPRDNHVYQLAPYEEITKEKYEKMVKEMPNIDFAKIIEYEYDDETEGAKALACVSGACDIDDVVVKPQ